MRGRAAGAFAFGVLLCGTGFASASAPRFEGTDVRVNEGHAILRWTSERLPGNVEAAYELQQSSDASFDDARTRYRGPEDAFFVSGLRDGATHFRVRVWRDGAPGPWSEARVVTVAYPAPTRVVTLMILGCVVFVATLGAILAGFRSDARTTT